MASVHFGKSGKCSHRQTSTSTNMADVTVVGAAPLVVTDVFTDPELVTMIVTDEVETVHGSPVDYGGDYDDSDYKDIQNEFVTEDGEPGCYGGDGGVAGCDDPRDSIARSWWLGVILVLQMDIVGFSRMSGRANRVRVRRGQRPNRANRAC